jgi:uncharacterized protein
MIRSKRYVLDSYALLCYLEGEKNADDVAEILKKGLRDEAEIYLSVLSWGELYYILLREQGEEAVELYLKTLGRYPVKIIDADKALTAEAAKIKSSTGLSYTEAFTAALAISRKAVLVTGDKQFQQFENKIVINWL